MSKRYYDDIKIDNERYVIIFHELTGDYLIVKDDYKSISNNTPDFSFIEVKIKDNDRPSHIYIGSETSLENFILEHQKYDTIDNLPEVTQICLDEGFNKLAVIENDIIPTPTGKPGAYIINPNLDIVVDSKEKALEAAKDVIRNWLEASQV